MKSNDRAPLKNGRRPVTLSDVARRAGVTRWVAGQILNNGQGNSRCGEEKRKKIIDAAKELNYQPNLAAQYLQGKRSHAIGLMVASAGDPLNSFLVEYLDIELVQHQCQTMICNTIGDASPIPNRFEQCVDELTRRGVDGVFCAVHHWWSGDRQYLLKKHPNTVFYEDPGIPGACYVTVDRHYAFEMLTRHLLERGRRRIGFALASNSYPTHLERLAGYQAGLKSYGMKVDPGLIFDASKYPQCYASVDPETRVWTFPDKPIEQLIEQLIINGKADAVLTHNDYWAATVLRKLSDLGIKVPDDVAVAGYFNHYLADWTSPSLTTVDVAHDLAAENMVAMLEKMIAGEKLEPHERVMHVKPRLVYRKST